MGRHPREFRPPGGPGVSGWDDDLDDPWLKGTVLQVKKLYLNGKEHGVL